MTFKVMGYMASLRKDWSFVCMGRTVSVVILGGPSWGWLLLWSGLSSVMAKESERFVMFWWCERS